MTNYPRKRLKLLIGLVILLLVIAGSSILFVTKIEGSRVSSAQQHHGSATTITPAITPTPSPTPTLTPTPTPSPTLTPTPTSTPQPLFSDNFADNSKGWYVSDVPDYIRTIANNRLTLSATNHKVLIESVPANRTFDDFALTTTVALLQADANDSVGLYMRGDSNLDHDYRIAISGNAMYSICKESLDTNNNPVVTYLIPPTHSAALHPLGQANTLNVVMQGPTLTLTINGTTVTSVTDTDYTHGQIALFVANGSTSDGVIAAFSSIEIDPLPSSTMSS
jgi:hypothetical protein